MHSSALLPQMQQPRRVEWAAVMSGFNLAMWGLFKKVVVADNLAALATPIFERRYGFHPGVVHLGALAFAFQIYCDFSGYTDIARGVARIMGFRLMDNFNHPYFATCITDFWRRWHISLSSWLRDYLYIPLGGSHGTRLATYRNLMLTMLLGGLWHGAAWKFVLWGGYQGGLLVMERILGGQKLVVEWDACRTVGARLLWAVRVVVTFHFVCMGWLIFRCNHEGELRRLLVSYLDVTGWLRMPASLLLPVLGYMAPLLVMECLQFFSKKEQIALEAPYLVRTALYLGGIWAFVVFGRFDATAFIYFQF
jgi:D-alanyl-lipoteichoic acid acyltransferase DltB (MBOAT superfamily)